MTQLSDEARFLMYDKDLEITNLKKNIESLEEKIRQQSIKNNKILRIIDNMNFFNRKRYVDDIRSIIGS